MKFLLALTLGLTAPQAAPSLPGFLDAGQLEHHCTASEQDASGSLGICLGYVAGSLDQILARSGRRRGALCPPADLTVDQVRTVVLDFLKDHPKERSSAAARVVERAAVAAYPCTIVDPSDGRLRR